MVRIYHYYITKDGYAQDCLPKESVSKVSDVAHSPLVSWNFRKIPPISKEK